MIIMMMLMMIMIMTPSPPLKQTRTPNCTTPWLKQTPTRTGGESHTTGGRTTPHGRASRTGITCLSLYLEALQNVPLPSPLYFTLQESPAKKQSIREGHVEELTLEPDGTAAIRRRGLRV